MNCNLCPRNCLIDRSKNIGVCCMKDKLTVARASLHEWEEPCISGVNGSGKSTIWEALTWALTGDTIRNCKDVVNAYNDLGTVVKLDFNVDNDNYLIIRSKSHTNLGTNLKIYIKTK